MEQCVVECDISDAEVTGQCITTKPDIPELPSSVTKPKLPTIKDVTTETIDGTGVFDIYMRAGMNQLMTQYDAGRIKGSDFAQAYVAQIELMMTEANKFVIGLVQAEVALAMFDQQYLGAAYDALVKEHSVHKTKAETDLLCQQVAELKANGRVERELKKAQKQTQIKQADLYTRQITSFKEKTSLDSSKILFDAWAVQAVEDISGPYQLQGFMTTAQTDGTDGTGLKVTKELAEMAQKLQD